MRSALDGMELTVLRQSFDCLNLAALVLDRKRQTGIDSLTVHQHGASAARSLIAPLLRAHQLQAIPEGVQQRHARVDQEGMSSAVHTQSDVQQFLRHAGTRMQYRVLPPTSCTAHLWSPAAHDEADRMAHRTFCAGTQHAFFAHIDY